MPTATTLTLACLLLQSTNETAPPRFAPPVPLTADGVIIDVTTGHAAPCIHDFDRDGVRDLLVGEFGAGAFKGETTGKSSPGHPWVAGKLRFYRNHGTDTAPIYTDFSYVKAGTRDAQVPITCCVSFVPQFIDFNADGIEDMISGSYPGDIYFFAGNETGGFDEPVMQRDVNGDAVHARYEHSGELHDVHSITAELHDMDADGDYIDYLVGLQFSQPIGNRAAESVLQQARLRRSSAVIGYRNAIQDVVLDVKNAVRDIAAGYALVAQARNFRLAQAENLRSLEALRETLAALTPEFLNLLFQRQERLGEAQFQELQAMAVYNLSIAELGRATGSGLEANGIDLVVVGPDAGSAANTLDGGS